MRLADRSLVIAMCLGQLGNLAERRGDLAQASQRLVEALKTFQTLGEPHMEAVAWHQLGMVAEGSRDWEQAEHYYREAVRIREQIHDLPMPKLRWNPTRRSGSSERQGDWRSTSVTSPTSRSREPSRASWPIRRRPAAAGPPRGPMPSVRSTS